MSNGVFCVFFVCCCNPNHAEPSAWNNLAMLCSLWKRTNSFACLLYIEVPALRKPAMFQTDHLPFIASSGDRDTNVKPFDKSSWDTIKKTIIIKCICGSIYVYNIFIWICTWGYHLVYNSYRDIFVYTEKPHIFVVLNIAPCGTQMFFSN